MLNIYNFKGLKVQIGKVVILSPLFFFGTLQAQDSCTIPQNITMAGTGTAHASLTWDASALPAYGYDWEVRDEGTEEALQSGSVQSAALLIQNLTAGTGYIIALRAHCDTTLYSEWTTQNITTRPLISAFSGQIGTGSNANAGFGASYGPLMYTGVVTRNGSASNMLFTEEEMLNAGIPQGASITGVAFDKINNSSNEGDTYPDTRVRVLAANSTNIAPLSMLTTRRYRRHTYTINR